MNERSPQLSIVEQGPNKSLEDLKAELEALKYENKKLKSINDVLVQRVELGWGNFSAAYTSFERAAMLTEQVESKSRALQKTRYRLDEAELDLSRTQEERDLSEQRLRDLIESIHDAIALFDVDRKLVMANAGFRKFWRDTGATIVVGETRLSALSSLAVRHGLMDRAQLASERRTGATTHGDTVFQMADGRWMKMSEHPTSDGGLAVIYTDISAVKADEYRLRQRVVREQDDILHDMLDNLPQGVALIDGSDAIKAWNDRFATIIGLKPERLNRGDGIHDVLRQSKIGRAIMADGALVGGCDPSSLGCQREVVLHDNRVMDVRSHPLSAGAFVLTFTDVTERSRDATVIRESKRRLRLMTDALPALIAYVNNQGYFEFANRCSEEWYDRPRDRIESSALRDVMGADEFEKQREYIDKALSGQPVSFEVEQVVPDGRRRIFTKSFVPHAGEDGAVLGFYALEQDVTEQRRTASALKHAYRHMEQRVFERTRELTELNDKLQAEVRERALIEQELVAATIEAERASESKVKFMAAAGHDLLQPMNAARLFAASILDEQLEEQVQRLAGALSRSLDDVESIITTLVDISKLEAGVVEASPEPFNVGDLLSTLADEFSVQASEAGLGFHYHPCSMVVNTDSQLLARILRNFLTNAVRYTDEGRVVLGCRRRKEGLIIDVADTGIGIEESQLGLIFGEFQRVPGSEARDERGLGLGLAIVDKLSGVLGCRVSVRSLPSRGSVFSVQVPYGELAARYEVVVESGLLGELQGRRVLVVDNDESILEGMEHLLSRWGCDVAVANDGDTLREVLATFSPDIAIFDYQLDRGVTGFELADLMTDLKGALPPVIMITANYSKDLREDTAARGFTLLHKPVKPLKLRTLMGRLLSK